MHCYPQQWIKITIQKVWPRKKCRKNNGKTTKKLHHTQSTISSNKCNKFTYNSTRAKWKIEKNVCNYENFQASRNQTAKWQWPMRLTSVYCVICFCSSWRKNSEWFQVVVCANKQADFYTVSVVAWRLTICIEVALLNAWTWVKCAVVDYGSRVQIKRYFQIGRNVLNDCFEN